MMMLKLRGLCIGILLLQAISGFCQEQVAPLRFNPLLRPRLNSSSTSKPLNKATSLGLPFFEDFTDYDLYPNQSRWTDSEVYINNTMCNNPISRGVATFDALNKYGRPYDTVDRYDLLYADSLTSQPFDLSNYQPKDSIYISFFYQPQGNGFSPEASDSFQLYFHRKEGGWAQVWAVPGADVQDFQQVLIPVIDTSYLYDGFQFRFVNKATINTNDDVWNLDYIRMGANRNINDTAIRDLAFTTNPSPYLNDYTSMPYRQFLANAAGERGGAQSDTIWNHYGTNGTVNYGFTSVETTTGTPLGSASTTSTIPAYSKLGFSFPSTTTTVSLPNPESRMVYQNNYFLQSGNPAEPKSNDSIQCNTVFDNYLAYDDGTAEKSYFLNLAQALPGKIAIEYHLNIPDTLRGVAIYFGQQVPTATNKEFSITVYSKLAGISGSNTEKVLYNQDLLYPMFTDEINNFTIYKLDTPLVLPAGVFYLGTTQPASSGSDSLYIGLDVNRVGGNHLYFNVNTLWQSSLISGALMIRPLLGGPVAGTGVNDVLPAPTSWSLSPNPVFDNLKISSNVYANAYLITDLQGRSLHQSIINNNQIPVSDLAPGIYFLRIRQHDIWSTPQKFIKL